MRERRLPRAPELTVRALHKDPPSPPPNCCWRASAARGRRTDRGGTRARPTHGSKATTLASVRRRAFPDAAASRIGLADQSGGRKRRSQCGRGRSLRVIDAIRTTPAEPARSRFQCRWYGGVLESWAALCGPGFRPSVAGNLAGVQALRTPETVSKRSHANSHHSATRLPQTPSGSPGG